jgi:crotonobetaine/carnitine-CoA ligase
MPRQLSSPLRQDTCVAIETRSSKASVVRSPLRGLALHEQTLPALLRRQADRFGERTAVATTGGERRSYSELCAAAAAWAGLLAEIGVERGERVATIAGNRIELIELLLGCAWMGAIAVPLDSAIRGAALRHALTNSGARTLIIETEHLDALARVPPPATLERVWLLDRQRPHRAYGYRCEPLPAPGEALAPAALAPGDTLAILYTTGAGGVAKGVCCPHAQFYWSGVNGSEFLQIGPDDVCFTALPLFHPTAINSLWHALMSGATWVIAPRFTATRYWRLAAEHDATRTYLVGAMAGMLMAQPPSKDDHAHRVRIALAPATEAPLHDSFSDRFGVELYDGYGSAETNQVTGLAGDPQRPGWLGRALAEFELAAVDDNDAPVADGEPGELVVRPRQPFSTATGYFGMPEATVTAWRNLWFHTGDRVVRDSDGWYRLVDRAKDAIRRRGENISSFDVEQALQEHPDVVAVAVFPIASELSEDEVMAAVVLEPGSDAEPLELVRFCEPRIAYFAIPRYIEFVDFLPLTDTGSVRKSELRERGVSSTTWDRERSGERLAQR